MSRQVDSHSRRRRQAAVLTGPPVMSGTIPHSRTTALGEAESISTCTVKRLSAFALFRSTPCTHIASNSSRRMTVLRSATEPSANADTAAAVNGV